MSQCNVTKDSDFITNHTKTWHDKANTFTFLRMLAALIVVCIKLSICSLILRAIPTFSGGVCRTHAQHELCGRCVGTPFAVQGASLRFTTEKHVHIDKHVCDLLNCCSGNLNLTALNYEATHVRRQHSIWLRFLWVYSLDIVSSEAFVYLLSRQSRKSSPYMPYWRILMSSFVSSRVSASLYGFLYPYISCLFYIASLSARLTALLGECTCWSLMSNELTCGSRQFTYYRCGRFSQYSTVIL